MEGIHVLMAEYCASEKIYKTNIEIEKIWKKGIGFMLV